MRWRRRYFLYRALRKRHQLTEVENRTDQIASGDILLFATVRNEAERLPYFLQHYRNLGVSHFLFIDNDSTDVTQNVLRQQPDVSVWKTRHSYKLSRFGMDWLIWLLMRYGHGHWCLTVDADELLIFPNHDDLGLTDLTYFLDKDGQKSFAALMLELYPQTRLSEQTYRPGDNPIQCLQWFDSDGYHWRYQEQLQNWLIQGGVRQRAFFHDAPHRAPTLSKTPLIKWHWRYAYVSSTHSALPPRLNHSRQPNDNILVSGVLLHTKFLPMVVERSAEEQKRKQHFSNSTAYDDYYAALTNDPFLWSESSTKFTGWQQLESLGLMSRGGWCQSVDHNCLTSFRKG